MYNIFEVCYACLLLYYFGRLLTHKRSAFVLLGLGIAFVLSSILIFIVSKGVFFGQISSYVTITGAFLLLIGISFYLIELLQGKLSLKGQKKFPVFVVVGVGISYLASLPFLIYSSYYFNDSDKEFVDLYVRALQIINIIVYLIIINGLIVCLSKKNTY